MPRPYLCVYGHTALDYILCLERFPRPNTSIDVSEKRRFFGGTGANMAAVAASLGVPTALCSFVGEDFPEDFRRFLLGCGVDLRDLVEVPGFETPTVWIVSNASNDQIAYVYQGPMARMEDFEPRLRSAKEAEVVHICTGRPGYYLRVMEECRGMGKYLSFDPAQELHNVWSAETFGRALRMCDAFFANESELRTAMRYLGASRPEMLLDMVKVFVNTRGPRGSVVYQRGERSRVPAIVPQKVVDTTGAGDAFRAGFYAGRYRGYSLRECAVIGSAAASFAVEAMGSVTRIPSWEEVMERGKGPLREISR